MIPTPEQVAEAKRIIGVIDGRLERWRAWFPNDRSEVEIPRCDLLLLVELARDRLRIHREVENGGPV
jgi:hypothetical protein